jgi:hypothetical protein
MFTAISLQSPAYARKPASRPSEQVTEYDMGVSVLACMNGDCECGTGMYRVWIPKGAYWPLGRHFLPPGTVKSEGEWLVVDSLQQVVFGLRKLGG